MFRRNKKTTPVQPRRSSVTLRNDSQMGLYNYHNKKTNADQDSLPTKTGKRYSINGPFQKVISGFVLFIIALVIINILYISPNPKVIILNNNVKLAQVYNSIYGKDLYGFVQNQLSSSILNNNKLFINLSGISKKIRSNYPVFNVVNMSDGLISHQVTVTLLSEDPSFYIVSKDSGNYVLDQNGVAILKYNSPLNQIGLNLATIQDHRNISYKIGSLVLSSSEVNFINTILTQFKLKKYSVTGISINAEGQELDINLKNINYYIKFNLATNDPDIQIGSYFATANYLKNNNISPSQYVDVRLEGRVYYK